jgi:glycosyltransferase involved in cell wall biosynthesis
MKDRVAVITRTKDRPHLLRRAIESVASQSYPDWVQVIVNDGGDPALVQKVVDEVMPRDERIIVHHNATSQGMQNASNIGIAKVDSEYIIIHDDDDSWQPEFLDKTVNFLKDPPHPSMEGVITHSRQIYEEIDGDKIRQLRTSPFNAWFVDICLFRMLEQNTFPPISFLFRRRVYDKLGPYEQEWDPLGDWEFNVRFLLKYNIGVIPELLANYHHRVKSSDHQYTNSVYMQTAYSSHQFYEKLLRNHWLREDLKEGVFGLGTLSSISEKLGQVWTNSFILKEQKSGLDKWLSKVRGMGWQK